MVEIGNQMISVWQAPSWARPFESRQMDPASANGPSRALDWVGCPPGPRGISLAIAGRQPIHALGLSSPGRCGPRCPPAFALRAGQPRCASHLRLCY